MIKSKLDNGVKEVELDMTEPEDLVGCSYSLPIVDYVRCPNCNQIVPYMEEDEFEITDVWEDDGGNTDEYGEYTGRKEFTCPECNKTYKWYDESPLETIWTDDLQDIPNIDDIVPHYMEVYNAVYKIYEEHGEKDWAEAFDIYMQQKGGNDKVEENKEIKSEGKKVNLEEATIKALYDGLKDDTEVDEVEGIIDDVLVVTDPEITTDEYNEVIERAEEIIEDTPEGEIPLDTTYLGEYLQICPICGGSFIEDHILEPGTACPICYETPESFVMVGKLEAEDKVAEDNGLVDENGESVDEEEPEFTPTPLGELGAEDEEETESEEETPNNEETPAPEEVNRPRGARTRLNNRGRETASKELPNGNILTENEKKVQEDYERYKVSFYVDSTETPKEEIKDRLNDALKNTGLASGKDDIEIEVDEIFEEDKEDTDNKELLLGAEEKDKSTEKEYTITDADKDKIMELKNGSAFTWEGMDASEENLQAIVDDLKENTNIVLPVNFYKWSGETFNEMFNLTDANAYQNDLTFLAIDLDNWSALGNLPIYKMQVGARWLDDIVDNNTVRQNKIDGIETEDEDE